MSPKASFSQVLRRAFFASVIADVFGSVFLSIWIAFAALAPGGSDGPTAGGLVGAIFVGFFLFAITVVPIGTAAATTLAPLALRFAPLRTLRAGAGLVVFGAIAGFVLLYAIGFAMTFLGDRQNPFALKASDVIRPAVILGSVFGGLTAAAWWWLSPKPGETSPDSRSPL